MPILEQTLVMEESSKTIPMLFLAGVFCVFYLLLAALRPINVFEGERLATDSYTRLNQMLFVREQGHWNNSIYPRSKAPYGESIH